jgi:hypothetical protein
MQATPIERVFGRLRSFLASSGVLVLLLLLPAFCLWLTPNTTIQTRLVDASVYTGYVLNYESLIERYGTTYYSIRLAGILPGRFFAALFGPDDGYDVTRYWVLLVGVLSFFAIIRCHQSRAVSLVATLFFCFSPLYLRSVTSEYVDGIAIGYVVAGFAFVVRPTWHWHSNMLAAGFCFSLAANTNPFTLAIIGTFVPTALMLRDSLSWRIILVEASLTIAGLVLGRLVLAAAMHLMQPTLEFFFESIAFKIGTGLLLGGGETWFQTLGSFFSNPRKLFAITPAIVLAGAVCFLLRPSSSSQLRSQRVVAAFTLYLGLIVAFYLAFHHTFHGAIITSTWYLSYVAIPLYLVFSAMMGHAARALPSKELPVWLCSAAVVLVLLWTFDAKLHWEEWISPAIFIGVSTLFVLACIAGSSRARLMLSGVLLLTLILPGVFLRSQEDYGVLQSSSEAAINRDIREGIFQLIADVERVAPPSSGSLGFWYDKKLSPLEAIQSTYLYQYSLLPSVPPIVDAEFKTALASRRFLIVLASTEQEIARDIAALETAGIKSRLIIQRNLSGKAFNFSYIILELLPSDDEHGALVQSLPLENAILITGHTDVPHESAGLKVRTDSRRWFFDLSFQMPKRPTGEGLTVCARIRVLSGSIGMATVSDDGQRFFTERQIAPRTQPSEYCIPLEVDATQIVFRNWAPNGASNFVLESIGLYRKW